MNITKDFITALKQIFDSGQWAPDSQLKNVLNFVYQINLSLNEKYVHSFRSTQYYII